MKYYEIDGYYFKAMKKETALSAFWIIQGRSGKATELRSVVHLDKTMFRDSAAIVYLCGSEVI
jgi:hypothetical protein